MTSGAADRLMRPGGPFEVVGGPGRQARFVSGPQSLVEIVLRAERYGGRSPFNGADGLTFQDIFFKARRVAAGLAGVGRGRIGLVAADPTAWLVGFAGIVLAGRTPVLLNPQAGEADLVALQRTTQLALVLVDAMGGGLPAGLGPVQPIATMSGRDPSGRTVGANADPAAEALVVTTSGSTGRAKAVSFDQKAVAFGLRGMLLASHLSSAGDAPAGRMGSLPCALVTAPLFHVSGFVPLLLALLTGLRIAVVDGWPGEAVGETVSRYGVTSIGGLTPYQARDLLRIAPSQLSGLAALSVQGAHLPTSTLRALRNHLPQVRITSGYGLTESLGGVTMAGDGELRRHPGTSGRPPPTTAIRIMDESGQPRPQGGAGVVEISGPGLGVYCDAGAHPTVGDWFSTGDLGYLDGEGRLFVIGRKDVCRSIGDEILAGPHLEALALEVPTVRRVRAFPSGDGFTVEVVGEEGAEVSARQVIRQALPRVCGAVSVVRTSHLNLTATGKVSSKAG